MEVILLQRIGNLGKLGDKVNVKSGYGRNYLIPQGKAVSATEKNIAAFEARRAELEKIEAELLAAAQARAETLKDVNVILRSKSGEEGKLFGSIGTRDIADALTNSGIAVERHEVKMPEGVIRVLGEYSIDIQLHHDVTETITVTVLDEDA